MLEYEKKVLLTEEEYRCLKKYFILSGKTSFQTNYYYDTDTYLLNKINFTLRIREKNGKFKATIKQHTQKHDCSIELTGDAVSEYDDSFFKSYEVMLHGKLITERITLGFDSGISIMLDKNDYLGTTDYELEIEYPRNLESSANAEMNIIELILAEADVLIPDGSFVERYYRSTPKSKRFFTRLEQMKRGEGTA